VNAGPHISLDDAARILRVNRKTVARWCDKGKLPCTRTLGGHRRVLRADVVALARQLAEQRTQEGQ
jgi:excisionase family DNA binding protein